MSKRREITIGDVRTYGHLTEMDVAAQLKYAPATHICVCLNAPNILAGQTFSYEGNKWVIIKVRPGADDAKALEELSGQKLLETYQKSRAGKFLSLLVLMER